MNETRWERWGAASGFAVLAVGAVATTFERGAPSVRDPVAKVAAFFADNRGALLAQSLVFLIGAGILLWFVGSLRSFLIRAEGGTGRVSTVVFGAGIAWAGISVVAQAFQIGLAVASTGTVEPAGVGPMYAVGVALFTVAYLPLAVLLTAVAVVSLRTTAFPAWLGWFSVAAAAVHLVPVFGIVADNGPLALSGWLSTYAPYPLFAVWLVSVTVVMISRIGKPTPATVIPDTAQELIDRTRRHTG